MANKMLIDATHPEETRVVVLRGNRVEEFAFETAHRRQLRGNIYLAKVTRVEPSLQAAFVEDDGNSHRGNRRQRGGRNRHRDRAHSRNDEAVHSEPVSGDAPTAGEMAHD